MTEVQAEPTVVLRSASGPEEIAAAADLRREVFVVEQGIFVDTDRDVRDEDEATIHLIALVDGEIAGTVRIYRLDDHGTWLGDRLAVSAPHRVLQLGAGLVRLAVETGGRLGGTVMHAHIQLPNVAFFERLGWQRSGPTEDYLGTPHQPMTINLVGS